MRKLQEDMERDRSFDKLVDFGYRQGQSFQQVFRDLGNINYDNYEY